MTTYLGKSCSFCLPRVPFVNCRQFMYLVISFLVSPTEVIRMQKQTEKRRQRAQEDFRINCWFSSAPVFQWCCSTPQGSPGVGRNTFLSSPHLCFIIVFICDLFVSRDDPLMS